MTATSGDVLVIFDASIGALCAAWAAGVVSGAGGSSAQTARLVAWLPPAVAADPAQEAIARRLAEACRATEIIAGAGIDWPANPSRQPASAGPADTAMLLSAGLAALDRGIARVLWPIRHGVAQAEPPRSSSAIAGASSGPVARLAPASKVPTATVAASFDRAVLVGRLISMDAGAAGLAGDLAGGVVIETPYLELTIEQLADLAMDMDVPGVLLAELGIRPAGRL